MGSKKFEALKEKGCHSCGQEIAELSQTLPICLDCLRSGKETAKPFIEKAHHRSRISFQLVTTPPRDASGTLRKIFANQCQIEEDGWGYCGLRTRKAGVLRGVSKKGGLAFKL